MIEGVVVLVVGVIIGHFLSKCIYCMAREEALSTTKIPGRKRKIWSTYLGIEALTAFIFLLFYSEYGFSFIGMMCMVFSAVLILLGFIDKEYMILPTRIIGIGMLVGIVVRVVLTIIRQDLFYIIDGLIGALIGYGCFKMLYHIALKVFDKEMLGFGDVRLMGMLGFYIGIVQLFNMLVIATLMASCVGFILFTKYKQSRPYPFGPFLCGATLLIMLFGTQIIRHVDLISF